MTPTPHQLVRAHQWLYYVGVYQTPMMQPVWTDQAYDRYCVRHGIDGGGSDSDRDYTDEDRALARAEHRSPSDPTL